MLHICVSTMLRLCRERLHLTTNETKPAAPAVFPLICVSLDCVYIRHVLRKGASKSSSIFVGCLIKLQKFKHRGGKSKGKLSGILLAVVLHGIEAKTTRRSGRPGPPRTFRIPGFRREDVLGAVLFWPVWAMKVLTAIVHRIWL